MNQRIYVKLKPDEFTAISQLAKQERRHPRDQAAILIREELKRRNLLPAKTPDRPAETVGATP